MEDAVLSLVGARPELAWTRDFLVDFPDAHLYLVGGAVRDALLHRTTKDFDFVIQGLATQKLEQWFGARGTIDFVGKQFGVYKFVVEGMEHEAIDIALPRTETSLPDSLGGYHEFDVEARTDLPIELDLARRDFTVNAIAFDLRGQTFIDPWHGQRDIEAKTLRAVGPADDRLKEDLSRVLRAIRFSCQLGFHLEASLWNALQRAAFHVNDQRDDGSWVVPRETVGREFLKSFLSDPACTLVKYRDVGLAPLLPETFDLERALARAQDLSGLKPAILLTLILAETPAEEVRDWCHALHLDQFPKTSRWHINVNDVLWLRRSLHALDVIENPNAMPGSLFERLFLSRLGDDLLALMVLTGSASDQKLTAVRARVDEIHERLGTEIPEWVSGDDLLALGMKPGPQFRELMNRVRDAQIDGDIASKAEAIDYLKSLL